ncbi:MAG: hypothetical protein RLZZ532_3657, partial [Cyanobacteriota bacterium]
KRVGGTDGGASEVTGARSSLGVSQSLLHLGTFLAKKNSGLGLGTLVWGV